MNLNLETTVIDLSETSFPEPPWASQGSFLHAAFIVLAAQVNRLVGLCKLRDLRRHPSGTDRVVGNLRAVPLDEAERHQVELELKEQQLKARFQKAMERHRANPDAIKLGLDVLVEENGLSELEKWALLQLIPPACSQDLGEYLYGNLDSATFGGSFSIETLVQLADPQTLDDLVAARNVPQRLAAQGLVTVEHRARLVGPEDVLAAQVQLTWFAFAKLLGRPDLATLPRCEDENLAETSAR